jgi:hypothetical protein
MELTTNDSSSENDRKMMNTFEVFSDKENSKEKKKKAKDKTLPALFEASAEDKKPEKRGSIFDGLIPGKAEQKETHADDIKDVEELSADEAHFVANEYVAAKTENLKQELEQTEPNSLEEAQVLADAAFIEQVNARLAEKAVIDDEVLDEVLEEIVDELEIEADETGSGVKTEELSVEFDEDAGEEPEDPVASVTSTTRPPSPINAAPPAPIPPPSGSGGGSGSGVNGPVGSGVPPATPPSRPGNLPPSPNMNAAANQNPNTLRNPHQRAGDMLIGGVIGYLIGRRRGRLKTEKHLIPLQQKLEKQVEDLTGKVSEREEKIRGLVARQIERQPVATRPQVVEKLAGRIEQRATSSSENSTDAQTEQTIVAESVITERRPEKIPALSMERFGRILVPKPETVEVIRSMQAPKIREKQIDAASLTTHELIEAASNIKIEGTSAKAMYEAGRLDDRGLRRVVREYLIGDNYERIFFDNLRAVDSPERLTASSQQSAGNSSSGGGADPYAPHQKAAEFISPRESSFPAPWPDAARSYAAAGQKSSRKLAGAGMAVVVLLAVGFVLFLLFR